MSLAVADTQTYIVEIENLWSSATHGEVPAEAHFSWFGGGTHNDQTSFWSAGELASPGMVQMAETGVTTMLLDEVAQQIAAGNAFAVINQDHWFCPPKTVAPQCGDLSFEIQVNSEYSLVTLVSMLGPSPDWFVGVDDLSLRTGDQWIDKLEVELYPYDGGTRSANVFKLFGELTEPPDPITLITKESGQIITPQLLGRMTFTRVGPMEVPASDFTLLRGVLIGGDLAELAESDNLDLSIQRAVADVQSRTEFEVKAMSPTSTPTSFEFTLEGSVFARGNVVQTIELFDYVAQSWELVDSSNAVRSPAPDLVVTVAATGNLSRFVEVGTMCIEARIRYKSDSPRQKFASNTDQAIWTIGQ